MTARGKTASDLAALAVLAVSTLVLLLPIVRVAPSAIGPNLGDPLLNLYFLEWGAHQLARDPVDVWSPPFFYPTERVLTLSDHLLGPAVAHLLLRRAGLPSPGAYNVLLVVTFWLSGWVAFLVLRRTGLSTAGALVGGWAFAFSGFRWATIGHYQVLRMQWIPAVLWTFDRLLDRPTRGRALAFLLFYGLHVSGGAYLTYLIHIPLAVLLVNRWVRRRDLFASRARLLAWSVTAVTALGVLGVFYLPYLTSGAGLGARHPVEEVRRHGATLGSFLTPSAGTLDARLLAFLPRDAGRASLFPGFAVLGLAGVALVGRGRRRASPPESGAREGHAPALGVVGLALAATGLLLADGVTLTGHDVLKLPPLSRLDDARGGYAAPLVLVVAGALVAWAGGRLRHGRALRLGAGGDAPSGHEARDPWPGGLVVSGAVMLALCLPVFFLPARSILPGMGAIRVPTRAFALAAFPLSFLVGEGWDRLAARARRGRAWRAALVVGGLALVAEAWPRLPAWTPIPSGPSFPAYVHWIATHPEVKAYLELPLGREPSGETVPMYLQTAHWRPLVNGYSAVLPPSFREVARLCRPLPDGDGLARLREMGVTHVVVHWRSPDWGPGPALRRRVLRFREGFEDGLRTSGARRVFSEPATEIYVLAGGP